MALQFSWSERVPVTHEVARSSRVRVATWAIRLAVQDNGFSSRKSSVQIRYGSPPRIARQLVSILRCKSGVGQQIFDDTEKICISPLGCRLGYIRKYKLEPLKTLRVEMVKPDETPRYGRKKLKVLNRVRNRYRRVLGFGRLAGNVHSKQDGRKKASTPDGEVLRKRPLRSGYEAPALVWLQFGLVMESELRTIKFPQIFIFQGAKFYL